MTPDLPDELTERTEEENEQKKQELLEGVEETSREIQAEQQEFLDSLAEEHEEDRVDIEVETMLPGENMATIQAGINGDLINRFAGVESSIQEIQESDEPSVLDVEHTMDEAAQILADLTKEPKFSKAVFYGIYTKWGPRALGEHVIAVSDAIEAGVRRKLGDADGFRPE